MKKSCLTKVASNCCGTSSRKLKVPGCNFITSTPSQPCSLGFNQLVLPSPQCIFHHHHYRSPLFPFKLAKPTRLLLCSFIHSKSPSSLGLGSTSSFFSSRSASFPWILLNGLLSLFAVCSLYFFPSTLVYGCYWEPFRSPWREWLTTQRKLLYFYWIHISGFIISYRAALFREVSPSLIRVHDESDDKIPIMLYSSITNGCELTFA